MLGRLCKGAAVLFLLACAATPQDLAPEVLLLSRIKRHLREELARTPNYTCLETISRFRHDPKSPLQPHKGLARQDTVRLEIVYTDRREWYGSPGDKNMSIDNPVAFIGDGMIGTGAFAMTMHNILEGGIFTYSGEEISDGRQTVKYNFRVPRLLKSLEISMEGARGTVGEEGAIWVDPQSLDLIRVESGAAEIPPFLPLEAADMIVDYARMRIGGTDVLLAQQADSSMLDTKGVESYNRMEFTHCRSYSATSEISFDAKPDDSGAVAPSRPSPIAQAAAVPAFLEATVLLTRPVSDKDAVGALIEGKISGDLIHKGKVAVPEGSVVHGRIRRLEHYPDRGVFAVGLEFTDVDVRGESLPFYADLLRIDKDPRIQPAMTRQIFVNRVSAVRLARESITLSELPGVASFFIKGANFTLPTGFRMFWRTRGIIH
jgi:hypothetical protein